MSGPRLSIIPAGAVLDRRLKARDLQVLCVFGKHTDRNGWCCRSQVKMAKEMDCARSTVQASIDRLVAAGWLQKKVFSTPHEPGERDSAHEYRVVLDVPDETQDVVSTPADLSAPPADSGSAPPADSGSAPINDPLLTDPLPTDGRASARTGDFSKFWMEWPTALRPDKRDAAEMVFRKLSPSEQVQAVEFAAEYRRIQTCRSNPARMFTYLRSRAFLDLKGAPPVDKDGDFVITPERQEWTPWLEDIRSSHGERGAASAIRAGLMVRKSRWPTSHPNRTELNQTQTRQRMGGR